MKNINKTIMFAFLMAIIVSPLIPFAKADNSQWKTAVSEAVWKYDTHRVERLSYDKTVKGPFEYNNGVFMTEIANSCKNLSICNLVDVTILNNGSILKISDVSNSIESPFWHSAQDGRFIYVVPSNDKKSWANVYEYLSETGENKLLSTIVRNSDDLNFLTSSVDGTRVYASILHTDKDTKEVKTKMSVYDYKTGYSRDDFAWSLKAPWQEILDVKDGVVLTKFVFDGGYKQLLLIDESARKITEVPNSWIEPNGDIVGAHFLSDGSVQYFQNFRLYSYKSGTDIKPQEHGGAYLNWFVDAKDTIQIVGDRMAYIDPENTLYVSDIGGVSSFGKALNGSFTLDNDNIYFESLNGYVNYTFSTKTWKTRNYSVTGSYKDILIGIDENSDIWYENTTSGKVLNIGFGSAPVLTDRDHAVWKGTDGKVYQATFSPLLDVGNTIGIQAYRAYNTKTVYLVSNKKIWLVRDEATYFTWFDSWSDVVSVSAQTLRVYMDANTNMGDALFAPGTRIKAIGNPRLYVVGNDSALHWIVSETVADSIYGSAWNKGIIETRQEYLWNYSTGKEVDSNNDIKTI